MSRSNHFLTLLVLIGLAMTAAPQAVGTAAPNSLPAPWQDTGLQVGSVRGQSCVDATTPGVLLTNETAANSANAPLMTVATNWLTGQRTQVAAHGFDACSEQTGWLFALNADGATAVRFSLRDPQGRTLDHFPNFPSLDGSVLYSFGNPQGYASARFTQPPPIKPAMPGHLFVSTDDGLTWAEGGQQFAGTIDQIMLADADAQSLYALVRQPQPNGDETYALYFSADAGMSWGKRAEGTDSPKDGGTAHTLYAIPGSATPVTTVAMEVAYHGGGPHAGRDVMLSTDGGRTFTTIGTNMEGIGGPGKAVGLDGTSAGILRLDYDQYVTNRYQPLLSVDGGMTFQPLTFPFLSPMPLGLTLRTLPYAPNDVFAVASQVPADTSRRRTCPPMADARGNCWRALA